MGDPFTTLHAKERPSFVWSDGFEGATDVELKILLQSIEAEFESRMILKNSRQACKIDVYGDRLREGANKIGIQERLDEKHAEHVNAAVSILTTSQIVRAFMVYKAFLDDVLYHCGPELVLLCAACLGKAKVAALKKEDRISLLDLVKRKKSTYISPVLGRLATEYGIRTLHDKQETKRKRAEGTNLASAGIMSELTPMGATGEGGYTTGSNRFSGHIDDLLRPLASTKVPERAETKFQMPMMQPTRQIEFMFSKAPTSQIPLFCNLLLVAIQSSLQWQKERQLKESTTDCITVMWPKNKGQDMSISLWVGRIEARRMIKTIMLEQT